MKFEKINNDKIKVTLNLEDLYKNNLDFNSLVSNPDMAHSFVLDVLEKAEKDYGFSTKDYKLKVETVASNNGFFVLTITRVLDDIELGIEKKDRKKFKVRHKPLKIDNSCVIYNFNTFDDFCNFSHKICKQNSYNIGKICKQTKLYSYKNSYYLIFYKLNTEFKYFKNLFSFISEFAIFVDSANSFAAKLHESGKVIFEKDAIQTSLKYF